MTGFFRSSARSAVVMVAFAIVFTGMMAVVHSITYKQVKANEEQARLDLITQVLPRGSYDNNLLQASRRIQAAELGKGERHVYLASLRGQPSALVLEVSAPDGYSGAIDMLVGVLPDGRVSGVRVTRHRETPGLGDYIEIAKSEWIRVFDGKSLGNPDAAGWQVRKDGGQFEHMAGATVTPRAVVKAVHRTLEHVRAHHKDYWGVQP